MYTENYMGEGLLRGADEERAGRTLIRSLISHTRGYLRSLVGPQPHRSHQEAEAKLVSEKMKGKEDITVGGKEDTINHSRLKESLKKQDERG